MIWAKTPLQVEDNLKQQQLFCIVCSLQSSVLHLLTINGMDMNNINLILIRLYIILWYASSFLPTDIQKTTPICLLQETNEIEKHTDKEGKHQAGLLCIYQLNHCKALLDIHCLLPSVPLLQKKTQNMSQARS